MFSFVEKCKNKIYRLFKHAKLSAKPFTNGNDWCYDVENNSDGRMIKMRNVILLSKYVIHRCNEEGKPISNLQLQKMLYYIQGYFLKEFNECAFNEPITNWTYGPVVKEAYFEYNEYGGRKILPDNVYDYNINHAYNSKEIKCIERVIDACSKLTPSQLVEKTHTEDPWKQSQRGHVISVASIHNFFINNDPLGIAVRR